MLFDYTTLLISYTHNGDDTHKELNNILNSYNLVSVINFPTRVKNNSRSIIDNIFLDTTQFGRYTTCSMVNSLSDHDAQMLELYIVNLSSKRNNYKTVRKIDCNSINEFKDKLSSELWQNIFENDNSDVDSICNSFLNVYLQIFYSCSPKKPVNESTSNKQWITKGIISSCKWKNDLYLLTRNSNDI